MKVRTLKHFSYQTLIHYLVSEDSFSFSVEFQRLTLIKLLDHGAWGQESCAVLERLVKFYRHKVTPLIVDALLPSNAKKVSLKSCPKITEDCVNNFMRRCVHVSHLDLSENLNLLFDKIVLFSLQSDDKYNSLTTVDLEGCAQIEDKHVKNVIKNAPLLHTLNIGQSAISDQVFLIDEVKQLAREASIKISSAIDEYDCKLQSIDISGCTHVTSTCIRHLCTLCGPTLRTVNMSRTKADCTSLLYLSGFGLAAVVQYFTTFKSTENEKTSTLVQLLTEFDDLSTKVKDVFQTDDQSQYYPKGSANSDNSKTTPSNLNDQNDIDTRDQCHIHQGYKFDSDTTIQDHINTAGHVDIVSQPYMDTAGHDTTGYIHLVLPGQGHTNTFNQSYINPAAHDNINTVNGNVFDSAGQGHFDPFYPPAITSLSVSGSILDSVKAPQCLEKFLLMNSSLAALRLFGGKASALVSDRVLELVSQHCANLSSICLEGCYRLSSAGIAKLAQCEHLTELDLTGVSFIDDHSIKLLINRLSLCRLQLAETMVNNSSLNTLASDQLAPRLRELDLSWCENIESDEGLNAVAQQCTNMERLVLRECSLNSTTLKLLAQNCHNIRELNISSNMSAVDDASLILLSENLPFLESIFLDWNSYLTDVSICSLLTNCPRLSMVNLEGLKQITSAPFMSIISVPEDLINFLKMYFNKQMVSPVLYFSEIKYPKLVDLPCLPHRSMTCSTELRYLNLTYCDFVEDNCLQYISAATQGSLKIIEYYGEEVNESEEALQKYLFSIIEQVLSQMFVTDDTTAQSNSL